MRDAIKNRIRRLHANQSGAIAMAAMAALLILLMFSLVLYDAGFMAKDKIRVQGSADMATWSQSAVEARSMNMLAFANVGKRITFGMSAYYTALWAAYALFLALTIVVAIALGVICYFTGATCTAFKYAIEVIVELGDIMIAEGPDLGSYRQSIGDYLQADMQAFDDYQSYMSGVTPWWSWSEGFLRGARNGALLASSFPPPKNLADEFGLPVGSGKTDSLPVRKASEDAGYSEMCNRSVLPDLVVHVADYLLKTTVLCSDCTEPASTLSRGVRIGIMALMGPFAAALYKTDVGCGSAADKYGATGAPYEMKEYSSDSDWLLDSSNLTFAYRPGRDYMGGERDKYGYLSREYVHGSGGFIDSIASINYDADGFFSMARSEISFQDGTPDLWHCSWTARMRPVSLPGEWGGYSEDIELISAWHDVAPYMVAGTALFELLGTVGIELADVGEADARDIAKIELMMDGVSNEYVNGVAR